MEFKNKTVIITGAAVGIGYATSKMFAQRGANVIMVDYNPDTLKEAENKIAPLGNTESFVCDISDESAVIDVADKVIEKYKKVDILVNNAGLWRCDVMPFSQSKSEFWKKKIDVNILGTMYFTRAVINNMIENKFGRIINIASVAGVYGINTMTDYSMTKGAVIAFSTSLAKEVSALGITVNTVSPGNVKPQDEGDDVDTGLSFIPRQGYPSENAELICFLASDKAAYISGQNYLIDGCRKKM